MTEQPYTVTADSGSLVLMYETASILVFRTNVVQLSHSLSQARRIAGIANKAYTDGAFFAEKNKLKLGYEELAMFSPFTLRTELLNY